jgi:hypothetical protein
MFSINRRPLENYNPFLSNLAICAALDREGAAAAFWI